MRFIGRMGTQSGRLTTPKYSLTIAHYQGSTYSFFYRQFINSPSYLIAMPYTFNGIHSKMHPQRQSGVSIFFSHCPKRVKCTRHT